MVRDVSWYLGSVSVVAFQARRSTNTGGPPWTIEYPAVQGRACQATRVRRVFRSDRWGNSGLLPRYALAERDESSRRLHHVFCRVRWFLGRSCFCLSIPGCRGRRLVRRGQVDWPSQDIQTVDWQGENQANMHPRGEHLLAVSDRHRVFSQPLSILSAGKRI